LSIKYMGKRGAELAAQATQASTAGPGPIPTAKWGVPNPTNWPTQPPSTVNLRPGGFTPPPPRGPSQLGLPSGPNYPQLTTRNPRPMPSSPYPAAPQYSSPLDYRVQEMINSARARALQEAGY
jgi:hypothetical protein